VPTERQRREAERRRLRRQLQRRAEREAQRRRLTLILSIVGTLAIIGVVVGVVIATSGDSSSKPNAGVPGGNPSSGGPTASVSTTPTTAAAYPCTWTPSGTAAKHVSVPPTTTPPKTGKVDILVNTSQGNMTFQLDRSLAPCAVESFTSLAQQNYFDHTPCHRLTSSSSLSVVQCGDPTGTGTGGPGYAFGDELSGKENYTRGVLAMANSGPNTNGSQFFIVYKDSQLPPSYTIFGKVTGGMKVIDKVAAKGSTPSGDGKPNLPLTLNTVTQVQ
jgi:peptidyl-prolyl cis-trans isomerase B (cyclophilin B)